MSSAVVVLNFFMRMLDKAVLDNTSSAYVITFPFACTVTLLTETRERFKGIPSSLSFSAVQVLMWIWMLRACHKLYRLGAWSDEYCG